MRKLDTEKYRKKLLAERDRIRHEMEQIDKEISNDDTSIGQSELADYDNHPADAATDTYEKERDIAVRDNFREILGRIDEALGKIERGTYGICDRCGREIAAGRLSVVPYAIYCVECQDLIEGH
ncbi:MAG: TraR/DksA C4-type zinc finger protein [Armatimonadota bacterium]